MKFDCMKIELFSIESEANLAFGYLVIWHLLHIFLKEKFKFLQLVQTQSPTLSVRGFFIDDVSWSVGELLF
jgi:hypothetical protein